MCATFHQVLKPWAPSRGPGLERDHITSKDQTLKHVGSCLGPCTPIPQTKGFRILGDALEHGNCQQFCLMKLVSRKALCKMKVTMNHSWKA